MYGQFAVNLNAFWNPLWGSRYLPALGVRASAAYEGYNYLGLGVLLLLQFVAYWVVTGKVSDRTTRSSAPLAAAAVGLFALGVSHEVYCGEHLIATIPLPTIVLDAINMLRGSGRLLWVAYYCILFAAVATVRKFVPGRLGVVLAITALGIQVIDLSPRYFGLKQHFIEHYVQLRGMEDTLLRAPEWRTFSDRYKQILVVPMEHMAPNYLRLGLYAADHRMPINVGYFARIDGRAVGDRSAALLAAVKAGHFDDHALYIINDRSVLPGITTRPGDALLTLDGMTVLAPGWNR